MCACRCCSSLLLTHIISIFWLRCSDAGCAAVFLPFWDSCGWEIGSAEDYADVVALCEARVASDSGSGAYCAAA